MDINKLTIKEAKEKLEEYKELLKLFNKEEATVEDSGHWKIGKNYFIRTVTHHLTGKLVKVTKQELVLEKACWIADDGRFSDALNKVEFDEVEPFPETELIVGRGSLIDAVQISKLPSKQK